MLYVCFMSMDRVYAYIALIFFDLRIKISFDALMQSIENEQRSIHEEATKEFASLGYCPDMVATWQQ